MSINLLNELILVIRQKAAAPINDSNKKVLIFTAFSDTAEYLFENISGMAKDELGLHTALVTGAVDGRTAISVSIMTSIGIPSALFSVSDALTVSAARTPRPAGTDTEIGEIDRKDRGCRTEGTAAQEAI